MSVTISQGLTIPATVASGQTAKSADIVTLYNTFNAFVVPGTVGVFQQGLVNDTVYSLTAAGTATQDWTIANSKSKAMFILLPFVWSAGTLQPSILYRINGATMIAATNTTNTAAGSGMTLLFIGPHDASILRPVIGLQADGGGATAHLTATADLPTVDTTSIGVTIAGTGTTWTFQHIRIWLEG